MQYKRGDVVLVNYPYTDMTTLKVRPAVIVSGSQYHAEQPDLMLAGLTSNLIHSNEALSYLLRDWATAGLRTPTAFKPVIATLDPLLIVHRIGSLSSRDLAEIEAR